MSMIRAPWLLFALLGALVLVACGGDGEDLEPIRSTPTPVPGTPDVVLSPTPQPDPPKELRVAFINLAAPVALDANDPGLSDTFDERLALLIRELQAFDPDLVGFNEASVTAEHGSASAILAKELKMEPFYARANPWYPGQSPEQSEQLAKQLGFEEGELILVRSDRFPIVKVEPLTQGLNPRTSESGERRTALHVALRAPEPAGTIDLYITHLTGGGERVRQAQTANLLEWVKATRGTGPVVLMGDLSEPPDSLAVQELQAAGFEDVGDLTAPTCCRLGVLGDQPAPTTRTDYLMTDGWKANEFEVFGDTALQRADGTPIYLSDHNGLMAVFKFEAVPFTPGPSIDSP